MSVWKWRFTIFCSILCEEVETIFLETNSDPSKLFQSKVFHEKYFRKWFWATFRFLPLWVFENGNFHFFPKFSSEQVGTIFWERKADFSKLLKPKHCTRNHFRYWFWSSLEVRNECSEYLKTAFFHFLQMFEWISWNRFLGKQGKALKNNGRKSLQ